MSRDLEDLRLEFRIKVKAMLEDLEQRGHVLRPFFTTRTPAEQAKIWKSTRSDEEVNAQAAFLEKANAPFIGQLLRETPRDTPIKGTGGHATFAVPMASWHNHGEAIDCYVLRKNEAVWTVTDPGYKAYAEAAQNAGLTAGYFWKMRDAVHVQYRAENPVTLWSWRQLDKMARDLTEKLS